MSVLTLGTPLQAEVRLASVFAGNMVLQRERPIRVWGWADLVAASKGRGVAVGNLLIGEVWVGMYFNVEKGE